MIDIIPAIDIIEGQCVRLSQGDYSSKKVYSVNPAEVAKQFEDAGIRRLHVVDLDGAKAQHIVNYKTLEAITNQTSLKVDFGGGLKSDEDLRIAFECGASMITGGSIAVKDRELFLHWLSIYGPDRIILGADAKDQKIAISGWIEESTMELIPFIKDYHELGVSQVICTDIAKDGMLSGTNVALYRDILSQMPHLYLVASGGVSTIEDIEALQQAGVPAVIFGKAIYESRFSLKSLEPFLL